MFDVEPTPLQSGILLRNAKVAYKSYGPAWRAAPRTWVNCDDLPACSTASINP
jgi:hypothetical protein